MRANHSRGNIFVANLPPEFTDDELAETFRLLRNCTERFYRPRPGHRETTALRICRYRDPARGESRRRGAERYANPWLHSRRTDQRTPSQGGKTGAPQSSGAIFVSAGATGNGRGRGSRRWLRSILAAEKPARRFRSNGARCPAEVEGAGLIRGGSSHRLHSSSALPGRLSRPYRCHGTRSSRR